MFDDIYLNQRANTVHSTHYQTVTEKRAPTDESVRLLDDFKKEASDAVVHSGLMHIESINAEVAFIIQHDLVAGFTEECIYKVVLNGKEERSKFEIDKYEINSLDEFMIKLRDSVANLISTKLIIGLSHKAVMQNTMHRWNNIRGER